MNLSATMQVVPTKAAPGAPSAAPMNAWWLVAIVAALFLAVVLPRLRRRRELQGGPRPGRFVEQEERARDELERLLTEIQDLSREHIAKLDTKIRLLNQLLIESEQRKKELEALLGRSAPSSSAKPEAPSRKAASEGAVHPSRPTNPLHDQVYHLSDEGKELLDICSATGLEKGEVELILGLRKMPPSGTR